MRKLCSHLFLKPSAIDLTASIKAVSLHLPAVHQTVGETLSPSSSSDWAYIAICLGARIHSVSLRHKQRGLGFKKVAVMRYDVVVVVEQLVQISAPRCLLLDVRRYICAMKAATFAVRT